MEPAFQNRIQSIKKEKIHNIIQNFLDTDIDNLEIFFVYFEGIEAFFVEHDEYLERRRTNTLIEFDKHVNSPIIFIPNSTNKIEIIDIIYQVLIFYYNGHIPCSHPFFQFCEKFYYSWIETYVKNDFKSYDTLILSQTIEEHLSNISQGLIDIFKNISISKQKVFNILSPGYSSNNFGLDVVNFTKYHILQALEISKNNVYKSYFGLGHLSMHIQDFETALGYFNQSIIGLPDYKLVIEQNIAICLYKLDRLSESYDLFEKIYNTNNEFTLSLKYVCLISYLKVLENTENNQHINEIDVRKIIKQALLYLESDSDEEIFELLGDLYLMLGNFNEAKKYFNELLSLYPDSLDIKMKLIEIYFSLNDFSKMIILIYEYLDVEINNPSIWNILCKYYKLLGQNNSAELSDIIGKLFNTEGLTIINTQTKEIKKFIDNGDYNGLLSYVNTYLFSR